MDKSFENVNIDIDLSKCPVNCPDLYDESDGEGGFSYNCSCSDISTCEIIKALIADNNINIYGG